MENLRNDQQQPINHGEEGIQAVDKGIRLPPFWEEDPTLWFIQAEAIFATHRITSEVRKSQLVISQLPYRILTQVADLAREPGQTPFVSLKERLIATFSQSQERRIIRLLEETQLGDQKPSQLLRQMQTLSAGVASDEVLKTVWLRALPARVRAILASLTQQTLTELANIADKILEVDVSSGVMPIQPVASSTDSHDFSALLHEIKKLHETLADRRGASPHRSRHRYRSNSRGRNSQRTDYPSKTRDGLCYYHFRFKEKARKCTTPCSWAGTTAEETTRKGN